VSLGDREELELLELCDALIDGRIDMNARARLGRMLAESEEARRLYVRAMGLSASLNDYAGEMQSGEVVPLPGIGRLRGGLGSLLGLAAAAVVVFGVWFLAARWGEGGQGLVDENVRPTVARLSAVRECSWKGVAAGSGDALMAGRVLELGRGFCEVTLDSGAQVVMEGPCRIQVVSAWEVELEQGTLNVVVPEEAVGFRVLNPEVEVVDRWTEFSVISEGGGVAEVFVHKGAVHTRSVGKREGQEMRVMLRARESRRFVEGAVGDVEDRDLKFGRFSRRSALERSQVPVSAVRWSFDEVGGLPPGGVVVGGHLRSRAKAQVYGDGLRREGRWGNAFSLEQECALRIELPELAGLAEWTCAFWVRMPSEAPLAHGGTIFSASRAGWRGAYFEVGWNRRPEAGCVGGLSTRTEHGRVMGAISLWDGRWHHVAVVISRRAGKGVKQQVKQYVDGRLDGAGGLRLFGKRELGGVGADELRFGGGDERVGERGSAVGIGFGGAIDELCVFDRALAPGEIQHLHTFNDLPSPSGVAF
jgi:hypothetical protein